MRIEDKETVEVNILSSINMFDVKKRPFPRLVGCLDNYLLSKCLGSASMGKIRWST